MHVYHTCTCVLAQCACPLIRICTPSLATPPIVPINRDAIAQQLMNRRGKVVDNYDEDTMVMHYTTHYAVSHVVYLGYYVQVFRGRFFVLSDTCCRTHKYLIGLALGVPCVRYSWIRDCIEEVCLVISPYFVSQPGFIDD